MRKYLGLCLIVLLTAVFAVADMDNVPIKGSPVTGTVTVSGSVVTLTADSNVADSCFGSFTTGDYWLNEYPAAIAYAHLYKVEHNDTNDTNFPADTLVLRIMTVSQRGQNFHLCTLSVDTLADTGLVSYWLGKGSGFTGSDSTGMLIYWDCAVRDSQNDSANHGQYREYHFKFGAHKKL